MSLNLIYEKKHKDITFLGGHHIEIMPHLHRELELIYLLEGEVVTYVDSIRYILRPGDVLLTFPNQIHSYEKAPHETHIGFIFKPDLLPELMETFTLGTPRSPIIESAMLDDRVRGLMDALYQTKDRESFLYAAELRRGYLLALCAELIPLMQISKLSVGDSETLRTIVSFCTRNYSENLSLSLLEEKLHLNRFYISHLFSKKLGIRFNDYINSLRISEACRYLLNSDDSITEIGAMVGFNTPRTFNRAFIRQIGVSPTEYRRARRLEIDTHIQNITTETGFPISFSDSAEDLCCTGCEDCTYDSYVPDNNCTPD